MEERGDEVEHEMKERFTLKRLQERVNRLENENKDLRVQNGILDTQYRSQCETQSDILRTLHANLDENYTKIEESDAKILRLEQMLEDQKQETKDKLEEERAKWESDVARLQLHCEELEKSLDAVEKFRQNKESMETELAGLKKQLQDQAEAHTQDISAFDRKKAIEIDNLKKDMNRSIKETWEMLKARTKDQLDSTTKRTIMENEQMATELHFQSKETERLLDREKNLLDENAQLRRSLLIHKDLENELARRTHVYQKLIKKMDQKSKADTAAMEQSRELKLEQSIGEEMTTAGPSVSRELPSMGGLSSHTSDENEKMRRQVEGLQSTLQMVRHEFAQYRRDHATLTQLQDQSTRLIISALYELKNQRECDPFPPATYDENADWQFVNMTVRQKEYFFRVLLEKLNSSMCATCFPTGPQSISQSTSSLPAIGKGGASQEQGHFSQFLWSVATHGGQHTHGGGADASAMRPQVDTAVKSVQTDTDPSDPCLKEGLWNPHSRSIQGASPQLVTSSVRSWGGQAKTQKTAGLAPSRRQRVV